MKAAEASLKLYQTRDESSINLSKISRNKVKAAADCRSSSDVLVKFYKNVLKDFQTQGKAVEDDRIIPEALGESSSSFFNFPDTRWSSRRLNKIYRLEVLVKAAENIRNFQCAGLTQTNLYKISLDWVKRLFTWNIKTCFLWKIKKINVVCCKFCLAL